jgi:hypothetical protein
MFKSGHFGLEVPDDQRGVVVDVTGAFDENCLTRGSLLHQMEPDAMRQIDEP